MDYQNPKEMTDEQIYALAVKRLRMKKDFYIHLTTYVAVNLFLFWIDYSYSGLSWFYFVLGFWGIGIVSHGIDTYTSLKLSHNSRSVDREIEKIRRKQ